MNQEIKIAVCDDLAEDRENITRLLSEYTDKNNLYVKIEEFSSGEAFLSSDTSVYSLVFMDIFMSGMNGMETAKKLQETAGCRLCSGAPVRSLQQRPLILRHFITW